MCYWHMEHTERSRCMWSYHSAEYVEWRRIRKHRVRLKKMSSHPTDEKKNDSHIGNNAPGKNTQASTAETN